MLLSDVRSDLRETAYVIRNGGKSSIPVHYYCHSRENPCQTPLSLYVALLAKDNDCINAHTKPGSDCKSQ